MRRFQVANHSCLMVKYSKDDRYDRDAVATHDRSVGTQSPIVVYALSNKILLPSQHTHTHIKHRQTTHATSTDRLTSVKKAAKNYGVIGIDEGQFVSVHNDDQQSVVVTSSFSSSVPRHCSILRGDGQRG